MYLERVKARSSPQTELHTAAMQFFQRGREIFDCSNGVTVAASDCLSRTGLLGGGKRYSVIVGLITAVPEKIY